MHRLWIVLALLATAIVIRIILGTQVTNYNDNFESVELEGAPYAKYVRVEPGASKFFTWGITASPRSKTIARKSLDDDERYGDTYTQAHRVLTQLTSDLSEVGLTLRDVVNVRAYVVGDQDTPPDFDGWNQAFTEFFGTADNPHKPARTTVGISHLFISQYKIEVEFVAVFPDDRGPFVEGSRHWLDYERSGRGAEETHPIWKSYGRAHFPMSTGKAVDAGQALFFGSAVMADTKFKMPPNMPVNPMMYGKIPDQAKSILSKTSMSLRSVGLTYRDVFFMRTIMYPEKGQAIGRNFGLFGREYSKHFNNSTNTNKPTRTVMSAPGYADLGPLMSLEMYGIVPEPEKLFEDSHIAQIGKADSISSPAVAVSADASTLWMSGVIAPGEDLSLAEETTACMEKLGEGLSDASASFGDLVHLRIYLEAANTKRDTDAVKKALEMYLKSNDIIHRPALTVLPIVDLPGGAKVEVEAIAGVMQF